MGSPHYEVETRMKCCPFCGAHGPAIQLSLLRMVCMDCGASGPISDDPEAAWELRTQVKKPQGPQVDSEDDDFGFLMKIEDRFQDFEYIEQCMQGNHIRVDGSLESVRIALALIFEGTP